jgi:hypothetical protein
MVGGKTVENTAAGRRADLDWMRLALVPAALLMTACLTLGQPERTLADAAGSALVGQMGDLLALVVLPMYCLVSGASLSRALAPVRGRRAAAAYAVSRVLRLVVPFIFGLLALGPLLMLFSRGPLQPEGSLLLRASSLWYLPVLFAASFILVPAAPLLSRGRIPPALLAALAAAANMVPAAAAVRAPMILGGWSPLCCLILIGTGAAMHRPGAPRAGLGLGRYGSILAGAAAAAASALPAVVGWAPPAFSLFLRGLAAASLSMGLMAVIMEAMAGVRPVPSWLAEAALPAFLLGQPAVIVCLRTARVLPLPPLPASLAAAIFSAGLILAITQGVRRISLLRFLFGLSPASGPAGRDAARDTESSSGGKTR